MPSKFATNIVLLLAVNLIIKPIWIFGIDRTVQNIVGDAYGLFFALFNFAFLFHAILDFGIHHFTNTSLARSPKALSTFLNQLLPVKLLLGIAFTVVIIVFGSITGYTQQYPQLLFMVIAYQFLHQFILYLRANFAGLHLFKQDRFLSVFDRVIAIITCAVLIIFEPFGSITITQFIGCQLVAQIVSVALGGYLLYSKAEFKLTKPNWLITRSLMIRATPYALLGLLMSAYTRIDGVMLEQLLGFNAAEEYAASYRLLDAVNIIGFLFAGILLPTFSKYLSEKQSISSIYKTSFSLLLLYSLNVSVVSCRSADVVISNLYIHATEQWSSTFKWLMLAAIPVNLLFVVSTLITANQNLKWLNQLSVIGILLNIIGNAIFIPKYGATGAAIITFATQTLVLVANILFVHINIYQNKNATWWCSVLGACALAIFVSMVVSSLNLIASVVVIITALCVYGLVTRLIDLQPIITLIKHRK